LGVTAHHLAEMLSCETLAIVGASDKPGTIATAVTESVLNGFTGLVHLVNPSGRMIFTRSSFKRPADLPEPPDVAIVTVPADALLQTMRELAAAKTKGAVIITDVRRGKVPSTEMRTALRQLADTSGMRILGPNALGIAVPHLGLHGTMARSLRAEPGSIAFIGQTATAAGPLVDWANAHGLGFSHIISLGDMVDVDFADAIDALAGEPRARCIVVFAQRMPMPRKIFSAIRQAARAKPLLVVKSRDASEPASRDAVYDAALRRAGALRIRTLEEVFHTIEALLVRVPSDAVPAPGPALAILANGESIAALAEDTALELGRELAVLSDETRERLKSLMPPGRPRVNPVDILPDASGERYQRALDILLDDKGIDAILVINGPSGIASASETADAVVRYVARTRQKKGRQWPWEIVSWPGGDAAVTAQKIFREHSIPSFETPSIAVRAFHVLLEKRQLDEMLTATPAAVSAAISAPAGSLRTKLSKLATDMLQSLSHELSSQILAAFGFMLVEAEPQDFSWRISLDSDSEIGTVLRFGLHGAVAHALMPEIAGLPPLNLTFARHMLESSPGMRRLRNRGVVSEATFAAAARSLVQASEIIVDLPEIAALDLDGIWFDNGVQKVRHASMSVRQASGDPSARFAFRPYPAELEENISVASQTMLIRPMRAEDEPAVHAFIAKMSPEDLRLRFFQPMKTLSHTIAARLTQLDYDREMAFVLVDSGDPLGVVRLHREARGTSGEFAITVRSDQHGKGIGTLLMERMISYARKIGLKTVFGVVLSENRSMLSLARRLGFEPKSQPDDPSVIRVELAL
jgi:acetyltransferase